MKTLTPLLITIALLHVVQVSAQPGHASDLCANAIPLALVSGEPYTFTGDNTNATATDDFVPGTPIFGGQAVMWHVITLNECMNLLYNLCGTDPVFSDPWGFLFTSCPGTEEFVGPDWFVDCGDGNLEFGYQAVPPGTYFIPVVRHAGATGPYTINISGQACTSGGPNDLCMNAVPVDLLNELVVFTGDNSNATDVNDWVVVDPPSVWVGTPVAWHAVNLIICDEIHVSYCGTDPVFDFTLGWLANTCPGDTMTVHSTLYECPDGNTVYVFSNLAPGTWYIPVLNHPDGNGPYQISVNGINCNVSVQEHEAHQWTLFPNPATSSFEFSNGGRSDVLFTEILDLSGRVVATYNRRIQVGAIAQFDVSALTAGVYMVRATTADGQVAAQRLVVR